MRLSLLRNVNVLTFYFSLQSFYSVEVNIKKTIFLNSEHILKVMFNKFF